jgi:GTPase SAR1 family protein
MGAGKTSIARKLIDPLSPMPESKDSTRGVTVSPWSLGEDGGKKMNVYIWDFAGDEITHSVHRCFMETRCVYIYVYNGRIEHNNRPEYWLEQIKIYGGDAPIFFLINLASDYKPTLEQNTLKNEYTSIQTQKPDNDFYSFDIDKDSEKLREFRLAVMDVLRNNPTWRSQEISAAAFRIKEKLRAHFEETKADSITRERFDKIAEESGALARKYDDILKDLHALGICFRYTFEDASKTIVLNTEWITYGIYEIIRWGQKNSKHILTVNDGAAIFRGPEDQARYKGKIEFLFKLMCNYELAFMKDPEQPNHPREMVVPLLLPVDRPQTLPEFPMNECLTMFFEVDKALPPNIVPRVVVQRHEDIADTAHWLKGAVLHYRKGIATGLVFEDDRKIIVNVKGPDKSAYIRELRDTLKDIFESYKKINPTLWYKLIVPDELTQGKSYLAKEEVILIHEKKRRPIINEYTGKNMSPKQTVRDYGLKEKAKNITEQVLILSIVGGLKMGFDKLCEILRAFLFG